MATSHRRPYLYLMIVAFYVSLIFHIASFMSVAALPITHSPYNEISLTKKEDEGKTPSQVILLQKRRGGIPGVSPDVSTSEVAIVLSITFPSAFILCYALILLFILVRTRELTFFNYLFYFFYCCFHIQDGKCVGRKPKSKQERKAPINPTP